MHGSPTHLLDPVWTNLGPGGPGRRYPDTGPAVTLPDERYRAVIQAREFLMRLAQGEYKRVPLEVRQRAWSVLKHYPGNWDMERAAQACPAVFQEKINPVVRLVLEHKEEENNDHAP